MKNQLMIVFGIACALMVACSPEKEELVGVEITTETETGPIEVASEPEESTQTLKVAKGVLEHFPQDVKSVEAYLGHEFRVGNTPITPTEAVTGEDLKKLVGQKVKVEGSWNPGKVEKPTGETLLESRPLGFENEPTGAGLEVLTITKIN